MSLTTNIFLYGITLFFLVVIDGVWLMLVMKKLYQLHLSHLMATSVSLWPVAIFYPLYALGVFLFVVQPALIAKTPWWIVLLFGCLFGLVAYAAYDLTNQATLRGWPWFITVIDVAWGAIFTGTVSLIAYGFGVWQSNAVLK